MSTKRSKSDVWMPIYIGDYLADTMRLSTVQHGAYFLLMMEYWRQGPLPHDADELCAVARTDRKTWDKAIWPVLKRFFSLEEDGFLHQKRADAERAHAEDKRIKRTAAAHAKHQKDACKKDANAPANAEQTVVQNECKEGDTCASRACASPSPSPSSSLRSEEPSLRSGGASAEASLGQGVTVASKPAKAKRACRLPENWQPSSEQIEFARENGVDPMKTAVVFRDYWIGVPGEKGRKLDWDATWRNWVRRDTSLRSPPPRQTQSDRRAAVNQAWAGVPDIEGV
ncbi:hypothetical protein [Acetobacter phage phiAX1]|nr:hypothetical protein [Acetobacter phage phiAX1]